ncbi:MAG: ATP-binding protein [Candidatus Hydrogenedentes bacterium]|nr:ATP-binding protein [Candidatus Hydrogenedentota bacterium]
MLPKNLKEVTWEHIQALVDNEVPEDKEIEFKRELPKKILRDKSASMESGGDEANAKNEFLADVSAFANAGGGHIIYGIREEKGTAYEICGLDADMNLDQEIRRLQEILRNGIEPEIFGIEIEKRTSSKGVIVLVIHIPMSWSGPHCVKANSRFHVRVGNMKRVMGVSELRAAFSLSESIAEKIRKFRDERLGRIMANETPVELRNGAKVILHVVPMSFGLSHSVIDLERLNMSPEKFKTPMGHQAGKRFNLDGFLVMGGAENDLGYCQVYRDGRIEAVSCSASEVPSPFPSPSFEIMIIDSLKRYLEGLGPFCEVFPVVVMMSMIGVFGLRMEFWNGVWSDQEKALDRDVLVFPDVVIKDNSRPIDMELRPLFDVLWNAFGRSHCPHYTEEGRFRRPQNNCR